MRRLVLSCTPGEACAAADRYMRRQIVQKKSLAKTRPFWVAILRNHPIGCVGLDAARRVKHLCVSTEHRRRGIARMLMDTLISHCKSIGMAEVLLHVISVSSAAISFYKSYGFVEESRRRFDDYDIITMKLTLSSFLSPEQIESFKRDGYLVVPGILSAKEVSEAQDGMWATLAEHGVEKERLHETAHNLRLVINTWRWRSA